jgi:pimeloyl-ACP methyl ester carboxylesterase
MSIKHNLVFRPLHLLYLLMTFLTPSTAFFLRFGSHTVSRQAARVSPGHSTTRLTSFLKQSSSSLKGVKNYSDMTIADTPLGTKQGSELLDGLDVYSVQASGDQHPLSVYGIESSDPKEDHNVLLMLHGRTWSSIPVYHLLGGPKNAEKGLESHSLMEELLSRNIQVYAMDFRGFGGTPRDATKGVDPNRCVEDVESVLGWIKERHGPNTSLSLLGWSQGALVAQLAAQRRNPAFSKLILYGSIYDPLVRYPREPLYVQNKDRAPDIENTFDAAVEDFTIEGTIPPEPARKFAEAALLSDPVKAQWKQLHQFNNLDPAHVHVPTLVVAGDQDPYAPLRVQQELFVNLARGSDKTWSILANADHAVHLLEGRSRFASVVTSFLRNSKTREDRS